MGRRNDLRINTIMPPDIAANIQASIQEAFFKHGGGSFFSAGLSAAHFQSSIEQNTIANLVRHVISDEYNSRLIEVDLYSPICFRPFFSPLKLEDEIDPPFLLGESE